MALTSVARPLTRCVVGGRVCAWEGCVRVQLEASTEQILEVVASLWACRDGFVLGRRWCDAYKKGAVWRLTGRWTGWRHGQRRQRSDGGNFRARMSWVWCDEGHVLLDEKDVHRSYRTASGLWGEEPGM